MTKVTPITPDEAAHINDEKEENALYEFVRLFNQELNAKYLSGASVVIHKPGGLTDRIERMLLEIFAETGWNIKRKWQSGCSDPREPTEGYYYYSFTASATIHGAVTSE